MRKKFKLLIRRIEWAYRTRHVYSRNHFHRSWKVWFWNNGAALKQHCIASAVYLAAATALCVGYALLRIHLNIEL